MLCFFGDERQKNRSEDILLQRQHNTLKRHKVEIFKGLIPSQVPAQEKVSRVHKFKGSCWGTCIKKHSSQEVEAYNYRSRNYPPK